MANTTLLVPHSRSAYSEHPRTRKLWCKASNAPLKIVLIWVLFYWRSFDERGAHGPHLLSWINSYESLIMHFSLLVIMFLPIYHFGCQSNQSNVAFWTKCIYSVEDYSSNISIKLLSTYPQWVRNKGLLSFFPVGWVISLLIYIVCPGLLSQLCHVISGLCVGITTPIHDHSLPRLAPL